MDELLRSSPSSSEPDSPGGLNRGCLLDPADLLYHDMSVIVPETPSPQLGKRRRRRQIAEECFSPVEVGASLGRPEQSLSRERGSACGSKRRRLEAAMGKQRVLFVPASSLITFPRGSALSTASRFSSSSSSSSPSSSSSSTASSSSTSSSSSYFTPASEEDVAGSTGEASHGSVGQLRRQSVTMSPSPSSDSLSFLTAEERRWLNSEQQNTVAAAAEEIIISDDDEAMVRLVQLEEDEALAQSLQAQFDQEEVQSSHQQHHYQHSHHRYYSHMEPSWMSHMLAAVTSPAGAEETLIGQQRRRGRTRGRNTGDTLLENPPPNDYEALLAFEERQGAVVSKKLTRRQIHRFPTKTFQSNNGAGNTQCQICFCEYTGGDKLRMLPCFHDYHVQCIDRWLKDNTTCPICRADLADNNYSAPPTL